jgi:hypothetical protein
MTGRAYLRALSSALRGTALPYGYTLSVWGAGAALISLQGTPGVGNVFMFIGGAMTGYGALKWIAGERPSEVQPSLGTPHFLRAGALQVTAITSAVGAASLVGMIDSGVAWPLAGLFATLLYILVTTVELGLLEADE